jgi:hypothetical protein
MRCESCLPYRGLLTPPLLIATANHRRCALPSPALRWGGVGGGGHFAMGESDSRKRGGDYIATSPPDDSDFEIAVLVVHLA